MCARRPMPTRHRRGRTPRQGASTSSRFTA
nr:MAG TPA: hypothetical protein [Caudoviricetes sp.]